MPVTAVLSHHRTCCSGHENGITVKHRGVDSSEQYRSGTMYQHRSDILISTFCYAQKNLRSTRAELSGNQPQRCRCIPSSSKGVSLDMGKNRTVSPFFEQAALSQQGVLPRYTVTGVDLV